MVTGNRKSTDMFKLPIEIRNKEEIYSVRAGTMGRLIRGAREKVLAVLRVSKQFPGVLLASTQIEESGA
jgi:hypothetical protein